MPEGSLSAIAKKLDTAIAKIDEQRAAVAAAQAELDQLNQAYAATVEEIRALHQEQQAIMQSILSFGGTQHVATTR